MSRIDDIEKLITNHNRRLQKLKEQQALCGYSTDAVILLEIEDIGSKIEELRTELRELKQEKIIPITPKVSNKKLQRLISDKQETILAFIKDFIKRNSISPTFEEIRMALNLSSKSQIKYHLEALAEAGFLEYLPKIPRSIRLIENVQTLGKSFIDEVWVEVPLGLIVAGEPIEQPEPILKSQGNFDDGDYTYHRDRIRISIPRNLESKKDRIYALKVKGKSMIDSSINDGDVVVMYNLNYDKVENGEMVAVWLIDREETTLKHIYQENGYILLQPANKTMKPIVYHDPNNVLIQGLVIKIIHSS